MDIFCYVVSQYQLTWFGEPAFDRTRSKICRTATNFFMKTKKSENHLWEYLNNERLMLAISITVVLIANIHVLSSFFWRDDFLHFYQIANWNPLEFIFFPYGGHVFIFKHTIFYSMFKLFGVNSVVYFTTVLLTHLGCAYLLFKIIHLLTGKPSLAAAGTMIWGICPVNYGTMNIYCTYGQVLVGFFFLLFLYDLLRIEKRNLFFSLGIAVRWSIYLILMATSFGTGLAIGCLVPLIIVIILWKTDKKWEMAAAMLPVIAVILVLFIFKDSIYHYFSGEVYHSTFFAPGVALRYCEVILEMFFRMCAFGIYTMAAFPVFIMTYSPSWTPPYPMLAFFISIFVVILFLVAFFHSRNHKRHYLVLSIMFLGLIGLTAYGRTLAYQAFGISVSSASMTFRYYYVLFIPIVLILSLMVKELLDSYPKISTVVVAFIFISIATSIYPSMNLAKVIDPMQHYYAPKERKLYYETIADIKKTIRSYPAGNSVFINNKMNDQISIFLPSDTDFPGKAAIFAIRYPNNTVEGRRVYFVENDCRVAQENLGKKNWRISSLMVSGCDLKNKKTE